MSFLIRMWREAAPEPLEPVWQGEVEQIQSGRRTTFQSVDELLAWLRQEVAGIAAEGPADT